METQTINNEEIISYLAFSIDKENFAINVGKVINILEYTKITKVPKAPKYISGIINLRGEVLPVIDGKMILGLDEITVTDKTCILIIETKIEQQVLKMGILVDSVQEVLEFDDKEILPSPFINSKKESDYLTGVVNKQDELLMIIDVNRLFTLKDISFLSSNFKDIKLEQAD